MVGEGRKGRKGESSYVGGRLEELMGEGLREVEWGMRVEGNRE